MFNWICLIVGLLLISLFWMSIAAKEMKKESGIVCAVFLCLGIVVYFVQTTLL